MTEKNEILKDMKSQQIRSNRKYYINEADFALLKNKN